MREPSGIAATNISARGRRQRRAMGAVTLLLAFVAAALLVALDQPRPWRLAVFVLLWIAGLGLFQAGAGT